MKTASFLLVAGLVLAAAMPFGCKPSTGPIVEGIPGGKDYNRPLGEGQYALHKLSLEEYPDFSAAFSNTAGLREAILRSLSYMGKGSSRSFYPYPASPTEKISHERQVASLQAVLQMIDGGMTSAQANAAVREKFDVWISVGCDDQGTVLFTGYYTPIFDASPVRTEKFRWPLYKQPADLVKGFDGKILGRKTAGGQTVPYPARAEIEKTNMLAGTELVWIGDEFEAYIIQVQGSARLRMPDGKFQTIGYAANNGYEYVSVGKIMREEGKFDRNQISLKGMIDYFKAHPQEVRTYTWKNPRYVFFQASEDDSPRGCLNEPVTKLRTVAADKGIFPRASLTFVATRLPTKSGGVIAERDYTGFALDQDAGGAIRAAGRCDVYLGVGDEAGELAGRLMQEGRLYYLFLKPQYVSGAAPALTPATPPVPAPASPGTN